MKKFTFSVLSINPSVPAVHSIVLLFTVEVIN